MTNEPQTEISSKPLIVVGIVILLFAYLIWSKPPASASLTPAEISKQESQQGCKREIKELEKQISDVQGCDFLDAPVGIKTCSKRKEIEDIKTALVANTNNCSN